jgi:membrane dipeptidase
VSRAPLFASHSSCRALSNISRNMSDEMIRAMAKKGGVIQINVGCDFLSQKCADAIESLDFYTGEIRITEQCRDNPKVRRAELEKYYAQQKSRIPQATLEDVVAHIDHVVKIAGVDAVGIGSDFDGIEYVPAGLEDVSKFPNLTRVLLEGGYSPSEIRKIYG